MTLRAVKNTIALFCLAVAALALFSAGRTWAAGDAAPDWLTGTWQGMMNTGDRPVGVTLTVDPLKTKKPSARFGPPWSCVVQFAYASQDDSSAALSIAGTNGGRCDKYMDGSAQASQGPQKDMLIFTLNGHADSDRLKFSLRKRDDTPKAKQPALKTERSNKKK